MTDEEQVEYDALRVQANALRKKERADTLKVSEQLITDVVEERYCVAPNLAQRLASAWKTSADDWNRLRATYEEREASTAGEPSSRGSAGPGV